MVIFVGLTGNVACGKSTIANHWREKGITILDTDKMAADVIAPGTDGFKEVVANFHSENLLLEDGQLNRRALGQIVFNDRSKKKVLEGIVWPKVYKKLFSSLISSTFYWLLRSDHIVAVEIPQLFESGPLTKYFFDAVVVVCCDSPSGEQLRRLLHRNPDIPEHDARSRLKAQMPQHEKRKLACYVVENNGPVEETFKQSDAIVNNIVQNYRVKRFKALTIFAVSSMAFAFYLFL